MFVALPSPNWQDAQFARITCDNMLDGGLFEGLYILGAISSLGKTTFLLQMADSMAATGQDVLLFSLEMSKFELAGKSISRQTFIMNTSKEKDFAKTTRGIINGSLYKDYKPGEIQLIENAVEAYQQSASHMFIFEAAGDIGTTQIRTAVEKHKRITGNIPVVVIDYLQILAPKDAKSSDKQNTDWNVSELKRIGREHHSPIMTISMMNMILLI